jgi:hypothetical protein
MTFGSRSNEYIPEISKIFFYSVEKNYCTVQNCIAFVFVGFFNTFFLLFRSDVSIIYQTMDASWLKPDPDLEPVVTEAASTAATTVNASSLL